ncbi:hypothetical protein [Deinococcus daejeonensis]|uniref:FlgD Ig-like domain-containing protein n=1 Tax=Deinococcus daejeonensis TaxID=1007098 RepID=A0ABQ2JB02_9DEIO|nr:hypothetical protein [Deinococcus daejeonensis]GGN42153.1 hypothetical protein GCM10010842_28440 [Deinococcus daejeonensis]
MRRAALLLPLLLSGTPDAAPAQLSLPGTLSATQSRVTLRVKGLESPGRSLTTGLCQVRYTVFDRQGRALLGYPNRGTLCAEVGLGMNTARGVWGAFTLDLSPVRAARLPAGTYLMTAHVLAWDRNTRLILASNTATLRVP